MSRSNAVMLVAVAATQAIRLRWSFRAALAILALSLLGCGALTTSPSWVGGGLAVHGPLQTPADLEDDEELEAAPKPQEAAGSEEQKVGARHILVMHNDSQQKPEEVDRSREDAQVRAGECLAKLRAGASFVEMVDEYSDEPGASKRGGYLGMFERKAMVKNFSDATFALKVGEISEVVETTYGFHIIKRTR